MKIGVTCIYLGYLAVRWVLETKCLFALLLGIPCPFCGMTRAFVSVLKLDLQAAVSYHFMFWSLPILYLFFLYDGRIFKNKYINNGLWIALGTGFLLNWIFQLGK